MGQIWGACQWGASDCKRAVRNLPRQWKMVLIEICSWYFFIIFCWWWHQQKTLFRVQMCFFLVFACFRGNYERSKTSSKKKEFAQLFLIMKRLSLQEVFVLLPFEVVVMVTWTPTSGELNVNRNMPDFTNHATARIWQGKKVNFENMPTTFPNQLKKALGCFFL